MLTLLQESCGEIDFCERTLPFSHTKYYEKEMGTGLQRCFISFKRLIDRHHLVEVKLLSNEIENSLANDNSGRTINIDPGYLTDSQLVLATGKNFSHRIYLGKGVFADLTLVFRDHAYQFLPWTYPDYKEDHMQAILMNIRKQYSKDIYERKNIDEKK